MSILLLGANGQVGHALRAPLLDMARLECVTRSGSLVDGGTCHAVDLAQPSALAQVLDSTRPRIVVNAAAWTAVDRAEKESGRADRINHGAVAEIGAWAARNDALVVHYSTDYVFAGDDPTPRHENDPTEPSSAYGRSKLAGEIALRESGAHHLILRTAWVYAARGQNFLRTMLRLSGERDELRVVDDQVGAPTPAHWIAQATATILRRLNQIPGPERERVLGTYHLTASMRCSWFEFAEAILQSAHATGLIESLPRVVPIASSEYPTPARRPRYSVLDNARLALVFGIQLPPWQDGLREVIAELAAAESNGEKT